MAGGAETPHIAALPAIARQSRATITKRGNATSLLPTTGIVFLPFADEPEPVPFSAVWSPFNRNATLRNMLNLAAVTSRNGRSCTGIQP